ncbi:MAG: DUF427 domain-containing protein [Deltaproteobacteria bacterium]|nr:MAG: DUF427 domain-containing protein [Deltaproteobacteria bacterium]
MRPGVMSIRCRKRPESANASRFAGTRWTPGTRRTKKSSSIPAIRTNESTRSEAPVMSAVAETRRPTLVFETNHPVRYYIPQQDVRMNLLVQSATQSRCPYKGPASYWSARIGDQLFEDMVWSYMDPIPECPKIKGLLCFFHERGAEIYVDGEKIPPPQTKWARELKK